MKISTKIVIGLTSICVLFIGCSKQNFSPENVISKALENDEDISYYGELTATFTGGPEEMENVFMREWRQGNSARVELDSPDGLVRTANNGETLMIYEETEQKAYYTEDESFQDLQQTPREELDMVLDLVKDTHETEKVGEEEIAGRPAIHLKLSKRKDEKSLFGEQELWIDKENWMVLKMISTSGNVQNEVAYDAIEFNADHDPSVFELDVPEDVDVEKLDDIDDELGEEVVALEDVPDKFGTGALYFPGNDDLEVDAVTLLETEFDQGRKELNLDYTKGETPLFMLTVMEQTEAADDTEDVLIEAMESDEIRGQDAMVNDTQDFRAISWSEGDYKYSIMLTDPNLSWEQLKSWAEDMEEIKE